MDNFECWIKLEEELSGLKTGMQRLFQGVKSYLKGNFMFRTMVDYGEVKLWRAKWRTRGDYCSLQACVNLFHFTLNDKKGQRMKVINEKIQLIKIGIRVVTKTEWISTLLIKI